MEEPSQSSSEPFCFRAVAPADLARCDEASSFLQSGFWGSFKARFGWNARAFLVDWGNGRKAPLLVIRRRLGFGLSFAYVPWGPELPASAGLGTETGTALAALASALRSLLPQDTAFIRFDPPWPVLGGADTQTILGPSFKRAGADVQPPDTVIVDLDFSDEELLAAMKPKWRYNIRLAEKRGVTVHRRDEAGLDSFYRLYRETAARDRIAIHGIDYYAVLFDHGKKYRDGNQDLRLYVAEHDGDAIAAVIVLFRGEEATYLYGASADHKRNLMAPYALQWRAMADARAAGCRRYDLFGIPPHEDPTHPMAGLYRFKTGFGGRVVHRCGSWDLYYKPLAGKLFRAAESGRKTLRSARKALRSSGRGGPEQS